MKCRHSNTLELADADTDEHANQWWWSSLIPALTPHHREPARRKIDSLGARERGESSSVARDCQCLLNCVRCAEAAALRQRKSFAPKFLCLCESERVPRVSVAPGDQCDSDPPLGKLGCRLRRGGGGHCCHHRQWPLSQHMSEDIGRRRRKVALRS